MEAFIVQCALFEHFFIELLKVFGEEGKKLKKLTLGGLNRLFIAKDISSEIGKETGFFVELRNNCSHGLINIDIKKLEQEIQSNTKRFDNLINEMRVLLVSLSNKKISGAVGRDIERKKESSIKRIKKELGDFSSRGQL